MARFEILDSWTAFGGVETCIGAAEVSFSDLMTPPRGSKGPAGKVALQSGFLMAIVTGEVQVAVH